MIWHAKNLRSGNLHYQLVKMQNNLDFSSCNIVNWKWWSLLKVAFSHKGLSKTTIIQFFFHFSSKFLWVLIGCKKLVGKMEEKLDKKDIWMNRFFKTIKSWNSNNKGHFFSDHNFTIIPPPADQTKLTTKIFFWILDIIYRQMADKILNLIRNSESWLNSTVLLYQELFSIPNFKQTTVKLGGRKFKLKV